MLKARPSAIVAARQVVEGREIVTVVPITHTPPTEPADAIEIRQDSFRESRGRIQTAESRSSAARPLEKRPKTGYM